MRHSLLAVLLLVAGAFPLAAQNKPPQKNRGSGANTSTTSSAPASASDRPIPAQAGKPRSAALTPAREAAAMAFVKQNHAELVELLLYLKEKQPSAYEQAILDLFRASEHLAQQKEQNLERYELELAIWKNESRIELVAARLKMAGRDSPEGESLLPELKQLLEERYELRAQRMQDERQRLADRLEKIDRQLEMMKANLDQNVERDLQRLLGQGPVKKPEPRNNDQKNKLSGENRE